MAVQRKMFTLMAIAAMLIQVTMAADHAVGAPGGGWDLVTNLATWASANTFLVGDNLIFTYGGSHSVLEVTAGDYDKCVTSNPIMSDTSGSTTISLDSATKRYFICGTFGHCPSGMKVEIDTQAAATPPPATPATPPPVTPSPPPPVTPSPPPPVTPAPPPPATPATPPPASPKAPPPHVSHISPSTPYAKPPSMTGPSPSPTSASSPKSGIHFTLAMGVVGAVMVFLSL